MKVVAQASREIRADSRRQQVPGKMSLAFGVLTVVSVLWIWLISAETPFDPPQWLRIVGSSAFPIGLGGAIGTGVVAYRLGDRGRAVLGMGLAAAPLAVFILLQTIYG